MAIPVSGPQKLLVRRKRVAVIARWTSVLIFKIVYPVQLSFGTKLVTDPEPLIPKALNRVKNAVVKQIRKKPSGGVKMLSVSYSASILSA